MNGYNVVGVEKSAPYRKHASWGTAPNRRYDKVKALLLNKTAVFELDTPFTAEPIC